MYSLSEMILGVCWGLFAIVWVGGRIYNLYQGPHAQRRSTIIPYWTLGLILFFLLLLAGRSGLLRTLRPLRAWALPPWAQALGIAVLILSTLFTLWARFTLGTMWSSLPEAKVGHQLRTDGPYGVTRHPIYTGLLGMLIGSLLVAGIAYWSVLAIPLVVFVLVKIPAEERLMIETFGDQYRQYQKRVPQLIPGLQHLKRVDSGAVPH
jgi:protein-S-isoprenylcysteine O-methyltransferase Ste14